MEITFNIAGLCLIVAYVIGIWSCRGILQEAIQDLSILDKDGQAESDTRDNRHLRNQGIVRTWTILVWPVAAFVDMVIYALSMAIVELAGGIKKAKRTWNEKKSSVKPEDK